MSGEPLSRLAWTVDATVGWLLHVLTRGTAGPRDAVAPAPRRRPRQAERGGETPPEGRR